MSRKKFTEKQAGKIGDNLGITWKNYDVDQFKRGMNVELEHGKVNKKTNITDDNPVMTGKIALAHLNEFPDYYDRLERLEKQADKFWKKNKKRK